MAQEGVLPMQAQGIALWRWLCWRRREIWIGVTLVVAVAVLMFVGPWLLLLAAVEWKTSRRRRARLLGLVLTVLLVRAVVWLWQGGLGGAPGRRPPGMPCRPPSQPPSRPWDCAPARRASRQ